MRGLGVRVAGHPGRATGGDRLRRDDLSGDQSLQVPAFEPALILV
jgi:hypothetical protein